MSKSEIQAEATGAGSGKKKSLLLIIVGAVVVLAAAGGGAWVFLGSGKKTEHAAEARVALQAPPTFVTLDPFVVNLAGEVQHYLQVGIDLKIAGEDVKDQIKAHLPEIRNGVLLLLSSKEVDELSTLEGKNRLRAEIREAVNKPLGIHTPAPQPVAIEAEAQVSAAGHASDSGPAEKRSAHEPAEGVLEVLLTSFVIQ
jgi:flagellar FliL protein